MRKVGEHFFQRMILGMSFKKCLLLYSEETYEREAQVYDQLDKYQSDHAALIERFYTAYDVIPDNVDRISIPKSLIQYAQLEDEVIIKCINQEIQIWGKKYHDQYHEKWKNLDYEDLGSRVFSELNKSGKGTGKGE